MIFKKNIQAANSKESQKQETQSLLVWLEIGTTDIDRAVQFYENVFNIQVSMRMPGDQKIAVFNSSPGICLIERTRLQPENSVKPVFYCEIMHLCLGKAIEHGGRIIKSPSLLKQFNLKGETIIGSNLIDEQVGYIAEIEDRDGTNILVYSHC